MTNYYIVDYSGNALGSGIIIENLLEKFVYNVAVHILPGSGKDLLQNMGARNRTFTIKGAIVMPSNYDMGGTCEWFRNLVGHTGSLGFSSALAPGDDYLTGSLVFTTRTQVFYTDVSFEDKAGRPLERKFTLSAVEVK